MLGEADGVDLDARTVRCTGPEGDGGTLTYDRLVLAVGSVNKLLPVPGVAEHAHGFRGLPEALYLRDPDENGLELYWDRPRPEWPRSPDGSLRMVTAPLDLESLRAASAPSPIGAGAAAAAAPYAPMTEADSRNARRSGPTADPSTDASGRCGGRQHRDDQLRRHLSQIFNRG